MATPTSQRLTRALAGADVFITAGRLTLLLMVLYGVSVWGLRVPTTIFAALGLLVPSLLRSRIYWGGLAVLQAIVLAPVVYLVDNHKLLLLYWTVALAMAAPDFVLLRKNARLLIGLCFALAFFWKVACGEYWDGSFLHYTILVDGRFSTFASTVCGVSSQALSENADRLRVLYSGGESVLLDSPLSALLARTMSWWTLLGEGGIAACFLLAPRLPALSLTKDALLLQFVWLTYPVATVIGFGWLLTIMGYSQCRHEEPWRRFAYLFTFAAMQVFLIPWGDVLLQS